MEGTRHEKLIILGASGHGKVVADIAKLNGYGEIVFLDDDPKIKECAGYPVLGSSGKLSGLEGDFFVAVGNCDIRKTIMERESDRNFPVLIHPSAVVAEGVQIEEGSVVMAGVVISSDSKLGKGCIVNTCASVDHDCNISDYCHIAVGAHLCGTVDVGEACWIGAGATVINNISLCGKCRIGAGAVVVRDVTEPGTYMGVPARKRS